MRDIVGRRTRTFAAVAASLLAITILTASGIPEHVNDLLRSLPNANNPVPGGPARDASDQVLEDVNLLRSEPQVPANYYFDSAGEDLRIGGLGNWTFLTGRDTFREPVYGPNDWSTTTQHAYAGRWGFSFGNEANGLYRASSQDPDAYLVSPRIDLRSLSLTTDTVPTENHIRGQIEATAPIGADADTNPTLNPGQTQVDLETRSHTLLRLRHKFQLGDANDGARVEVFLADRRPEAGTSAVPDAVLTPLSQASSQGVEGTDGQNYRTTSAYDGPAFTGKQEEWKTAAFDLSPFAGTEIHVVLHVRTNIPPILARSYFLDAKGQYFPHPRAPFFGWKVDALQVEGPAHHSNLRVLSIESPSFKSGADQHLTYPVGAGLGRGDRALFNATITNRGSVTERNVQIDFQVVPFGGGTPLACSAAGGAPGRIRIPQVPPGGLARVGMDCEALTVPGREWVLTVSATSAGPVPDGNPEDNDLAVSFLAETVLNLVEAEPVKITPAVGETLELRTLTYKVRNDGNDDLRLRLETHALKSPTGKDEGFLPTSDVTFADPGNPPFIATLRRGDELTHHWEFTIQQPGNYRIVLRVLNALDGSLFREQPLRAMAEVSPGNLFFDDHSGAPLGHIVGSTEWSAESVWPPRHPDPAWDGSRWEFDADDTRHGPAAEYEYATVTGRKALRTPEEAREEFGQVEVHIRHYFDPYRIDTSGAGVLRASQPAFQVSLIPVQTGWPIAYEFAIVANAAATAFMDGAGIQPAEIPLQAWEPDRGDRNRDRFYRMQWVDETYIVDPRDFHPSMTSIPAALLAGYRLDVLASIPTTSVLSTGSNRCRSFTSIVTLTPAAAPSPGLCPTWWIDQIQVVTRQRLPSGDLGPAVPWMHTEGRPTDELPLNAYLAQPDLPSQAEFGYWEAQTLNAEHAARGQCPSSAAADPAYFSRGCPVWIRSNQPIAPRATNNTWTRTPFISTGQGNTRWYGDPTTLDTDAMVYNRQDQVVALYSPTIEIPDGLVENRLTFDHKYRLRNLTGFAFPTQVRDYGSVYVQFMRKDPAGNVVPDSQLFPLARPEGGAAVTFLGTCPDVVGCADFSDASHANEDLYYGAHLRFLNYSATNVKEVARRGYSTVSGIGTDQTSRVAFELGSRDLSKGALLRYAFVVGQYLAGETLPVVPPHSGWALGPIRMAGDTRLGHDVSIDGVRLHAAYDVSQGLGPGTDLQLEVQVTNRGVFTQKSLEFPVTFDLLPGGLQTFSYLFQTGEDFSLESGATQNLTFELSAPAVEGNYVVHVPANLSAGRVDENHLDNCRSVTLEDPTGYEECLPAIPAVTIQIHRDVAVDLVVLPQQGRVDNPADRIFYPRTTLMTVRNEGNYPLDDVEIERQVTGFIQGPSGNIEVRDPSIVIWTIEEPLAPGGSATLESLEREITVQTPPVRNEFSINFDEPGRYLVQLLGRTASDENPLDNKAEAVADAWEVFYSNNFDSSDAGEERSLLVSGDFEASGDGASSWSVTHDKFFGAEGEGGGSFWFGDAKTGTVPNGANASLALPALDLSSSSQAFLNFRTRYDLERKYDGGVVEASLDNGASWRVLTPEPQPALPKGYADHLVSSNPIDAARDLSRPVGSFTGSSAGLVPDNPNWVPVSVDIGRAIPEFQQQALVESFNQDGFALSGGATNAYPNRPETKTHSTWVPPGGLCSDDRCWYKENLDHYFPAPPVPGPFFYARPRTSQSYSLGPYESIVLNAQHPTVGLAAFGSERTVELSWWQYTAPGATPSQFYKCLSKPTVKQTQGEWKKYVVRLDATQELCGQIGIGFVTNPNQHERGCAITGIQLTRFRNLPGGVRGDVEVKDLPVSEGTGMWRFLSEPYPGSYYGSNFYGPPLETPRSAIAAIGLGNVFHLFGGRDSQGVLGQYLTGGSDFAISEQSFPYGQPVEGASIVGWKTGNSATLFSLGGYDNGGAPTRQTGYLSGAGFYFRYELLPSPRAWAAYASDTTASATRGWTFGGETSPTTAPLASVCTIGPTTSAPYFSVSCGLNLPSGRSRSAAIYHAGFVYVFGGRTAAGFSDEIVRFNPSTNQFATLTVKLPSGRHSMGAFLDGTKIYLVGGEKATGATDEILVFDPSQTTGTLPVLACKLPTPRSEAAVATPMGFVFGGRNGATRYSDVLRITPSNCGSNPPQPTISLLTRPAPFPISTSIPSGSSNWATASVTDHDEITSTVWRFGPATFVDERLATPAIDLARSVGETKLVWWEKNFYPIAKTSIEIQTYDRVNPLGGWGPWKTLRSEKSGPNVWRENSLDLTEFRGQKVRLAFRIATNGVPQGVYEWLIDSPIVRSTTLVGAPLLLRFRAGTDQSQDEGGWGIDNVELFGRRYTPSPGNVAVTMDSHGSDFTAQPGLRVWFNGTLRNTSPRIWLTAGVRATAIIGSAEVALVAPPGQRGVSTVTPPGVVGPLPMMLAGQRNNRGEALDQGRFSFYLDLPTTPTPVTVHIRAVDTTTLALLQDENLGDHLVEADVALTTEAIPPTIATQALTPGDPGPGEAARLELRIRNPGTVGMQLGITPRLRELATGQLFPLGPPALLHLPGETTSAPLTWNYSQPRAGIFALEMQRNMTLDTAPGVHGNTITFIRYVFSQQSLRFDAQDFEEIEDIPYQPPESDPDRWESQVSPESCHPVPREESLWRPTDEASFRPVRSVLSGVDDASFVQGGTYPPQLDDELQQPVVDLRHLRDPERPGVTAIDDLFLNFWYRSIVAPGDGLRVQARNYYPALRFSGPATDLVPGGGCLNLLGGVDDNFQLASFRIPTTVRQDDGPAQFVYRFVTNSDEEALQGVYLDSVTVSGYDAAINASEQEFSLIDNARKVYHVQITNRAPVRDTFDLALDLGSTNLPLDLATAELSPPTITLGPYESGVASVYVNTTLARGIPAFDDLRLGVTAASRGDPNRMAVNFLKFDRLRARDWPDLFAEIQFPGGQEAKAGQPLSFLGTITNLGLSTSPATAYEIHACPGALSLAGCAADPNTRILAGEVDAIAPFTEPDDLLPSRHLIPGSWTPEASLFGPWRLVLVVDPAGLVTDYDRENNLAEKLFDVAKLRLPDLRIDALELMDAGGMPITSTFEGELVRIRAIVSNVGEDAAPNVRLTIANQYPLKDLQTLRLAPQQRLELQATWIATAGTAILKVQATTTRPELTLDNNIEARKLVVRTRELTLDTEQLEVIGIPGDVWTLPLTVANTGESALQVRLAADLPAGFQAEIVPDVLSLDVEETGQATLRLFAGAAQPGSYVVVASARIMDTNKPALTLPIAVELGGSADVRAPSGAALTIATTSAQRRITVPLHNAGTLEAVFETRVTAPPGWTVLTRDLVVRVGPGKETEVRIDLDVPANYPPGVYSVSVSFEGTNAPPPSLFDVQVDEFRSLRAETLRNLERPGAREIVLRIENRGNLATVPEILLRAAGGGARMSIEPTPSPLAPGAARLYTVLLEHEAPTPPPLTFVTVEGVVPGTPVSATTATPKRTASADYVLGSIRLEPAEAAAPGQTVRVEATVRNDGTLMAPKIPVALYVDGLLRGYEETDLAPGASQTLRFSFAAGSEPSVVFVAVDPFDAVPEPNRANNVAFETLGTIEPSPAKAALPSPDLALFLIALALFFRRRRA